MLLCAQGLCAAPKESLWDKSGRTWGRMILRRYWHPPSTLQQNPNAPAAAQTTIVLPDFTEAVLLTRRYY